MTSPPARHASGHHGPAQTTQLDFSQAMTDFKVMFPDMDAQVIEAVLRSNNGAVDATIDHLLTMSADNEAQRVGPPGPPVLHPTPESLAGFHSGPDTSAKAQASQVAAILKAGGSRHGSDKMGGILPPSYRQAVEDEPPSVDDLIQFGGAGSGSPPSFADARPTLDLLSDLDLDAVGATASRPHPKMAYAHPQRQAEEEEEKEAASGTSCSSCTMVPTQAQLQEIYEANLRMREEAKGWPDRDGRQRTQFLEDERVALMLQNEEFMAELRRDHEFMSTLEMDDHQEAQEAAAASSSKAGTQKTHMDEAVFREKLKNMGKSSKRKFAQMASMFSRRKGAKQLLGHAPAPSKDNLLLNAEPLVNEDSEEEEVKTKTPTMGKYTSFS